MIRVSKLGDYAVILMAHVASAAPGRAVTARALAGATDLPLPTVSKLCKALAKGKLLISHRGKAGGFLLARPAPEISVAAIVAAIDGPIGLAECSAKEPPCSLESCPCRSNWTRINAAVLAALEAVRLDMMMPPAPVASLDRPSHLRTRELDA